MVLASSRAAGPGLIMAAPSAVFTIPRVAAMLGEDEDWSSHVALEMDPKAGRLTVHGINDEGTTGFTSVGLENLKEFIGIYKADPTIIATLHETLRIAASLTWRCIKGSTPRKFASQAANSQMNGNAYTSDLTPSHPRAIG